MLSVGKRLEERCSEKIHSSPSNNYDLFTKSAWELPKNMPLVASFCTFVALFFVTPHSMYFH